MWNGRSDSAGRVDAPVRVRELGLRLVPVPRLTVTATTTGAAQTLFTCQGEGLNIITEVDRLTVTNTTGTAATLTLHMIPSGDSIGAPNEELDAYNVPANTTLRIDGLLSKAYAPGTVCKVYSGTNGSLTVGGAAIQRQ